ncbi:MAG: Rrf2 family transcriptional regulator [Hyphomicrobium zavarzinii]|jgi:Rrf2 family nitric oxide-sensitive transcriptional repressor|uniref:RrF2 family transcriptional regulator n=1 Tax=Hyphomicrobium TaxID=81 RepID=UPI00037D72B3|nr:MULTISPECIES: Rrf2 family transcriptional regulator [Hyphomicrobium]MBL8845050.1 Rrf2 family transcriptional regulator [Hyphomicrobium zavarzinii]WBT39978.1 Rrf2 family transcriptional regulator [Hyphomicrobium sp. DMF-1]HML41925.1 Rrf2 family transcriptional regulator [Hyphomicrobium zavarzinii]
MRLTALSDYSLRVLMYLGTRPDRLATIQEIAEAYDISENHLMKVVHRLAQHGFVQTVRGRGGGLRLNGPAEKIRLGDVVRAVEEDFRIVECFGTDNVCRITDVCRLKMVLNKALGAFLESLDAWTLADLVAKPKALANALSIDVR